MQESGIPVDPALIRTGLPKEILGYQFASELLDLPEPPTALFTGNNLLTIGALRAIHDRNLNIPEDLSLVAFDDMEWTSLISPRLTVVAQPTYAMGRTAAELILKRIADPKRPAEQILFKPELQIRESTDSIRHTGKEVSLIPSQIPGSSLFVKVSHPNLNPEDTQRSV